MRDTKGIVTKAKEKIDSFSNFKKERLTAEGLAKQYRLPIATFARVFKELFNDTPRSYIHRHMMSQAAKYFDKQCTIAETAEALGYSNLSSFANVFRKYHGMFPSTYKKYKQLELKNEQRKRRKDLQS